MSRRRQANTPTAAAPPPPAGDAITHDVLIVGAGLAGINAAYRLQSRMPHLSFAVLEGRSDLGGTWDFFKFPGVRSDSDMFTFGFAWHPWRHKTMGNADEILSYMHECVSLYGLDRRMNFRHKVVRADWSSETQRWTVQVDYDGQRKTFVAKWVMLGTGFFSYDDPFPTSVPGIDNFKGKVIHPLRWPADYDYKDKKMVVVGSGATAVTIVPAVVEKGVKHVTMLQRSPSWVASVPNTNNWQRLLGRVLPVTTFYWLCRWTWNLQMCMLMFMCARFPAAMRKNLTDEARKQLPAKTPIEPHFVPSYNPWEQRLCISPDGDFFRALHTDRADVVTGTIQTVTADGIRLDDGRTLDADVIVTSTGYKAEFAGGIPITVDGESVAWPNRMIWHLAMVQDVPNAFFMWGYTQKSWTLGVDETALIACRLLKDMEKSGKNVVVPRIPAGFKIEPEDMLNLSSTYATAANKTLPKFGSVGPWKRRGEEMFGSLRANWGNVTDGLQFL